MGQRVPIGMATERSAATRPKDPHDRPDVCPLDRGLERRHVVVHKVGELCVTLCEQLYRGSGTVQLASCDTAVWHRTGGEASKFHRWHLAIDETVILLTLSLHRLCHTY